MQKTWDSWVQSLGPPGGRHGHLLQYSHLKNPMDRGAWQVPVHRVTKTWTQLKQLSTHSQLPGAATLVAQLCSTLCDPMDYSSPGFSVNRILQARILEWVAMPFSRGPSLPRDLTQVSCTVSRFFTVWGTREAPPRCCIKYNFEIILKVCFVLCLTYFNDAVSSESH